MRGMKINLATAWWRSGAILAVAALLATTALPRAFLPLRVGLDECWIAVLHHAFSAGMVFGRDLIFNLGPWGFVLYPAAFPATMPVVIAVKSVLLIVTAWGLVGWGREHLAHFGIRVVWLLALQVVGLDSAFIPIILLAELQASPTASRNRGVRGALVFIVAWLGLMKFTYFMAGGCVLAILTLHDLFCRRLPWLGILYVSAVGLLWLAAGQPLDALRPYLESSVEIAAAYSEAMGVWASPITLLAFIGTAMAWLVAVIGIEKEQSPGSIVSHGLTTLAIGFMLFKASFVRAGEIARETEAFVTMAAALLLLTPRAWRCRCRGPKVMVGVGIAGALASGLGASAFDLRTHLIGQITALDCRPVFTAVREAFAPRADREQRYSRSRQAIRDALPMPPVAGTVDIYPYHQAIVLAHDWAYRPRPIFQSYQANSATLARRNAASLQSPAAPATIFFAIEPLGHRYPAIDDGLAWPELLTRYDLKGRIGPFLHLERTPQPRAWQLRPVTEITGELGKPIRLPDPAEGPLWAQLEMSPTWLYRLTTFWCKAPLPTLTVNDRRVSDLVPSLARAGFLLSPMVDDTTTFTLLATQRTGTMVRTVQLDASPGFLETRFVLRIFALEFPPLHVR